VTNANTIEPIFVSVKEAARLLAVSTWTIHQLIHAEDPAIESALHGRRRLVSVESLRAYAATLPSIPVES
jgi:excisionase family DNA binding protein